MRLVIDTHLHFYPFYDVGKAFAALHSNLSSSDFCQDATIVGILTESNGCHFFKQVKENPEKFQLSHFKINFCRGAIVVKMPEYPEMYILPGRQIVTAENIELLCLLVDCEIEDGLPARMVIKRICEQNGVPVIAWSPGKWQFKRRRIVKDLVLKHKPGSLLIGDTALRPAGWPLHGLMKLAVSKGLGVVSGSDPFPLEGEEKTMGKFGILLEFDMNSSDLITGLRAVLLNPATIMTCIGRRHSFFQVVSKLVRHKFRKSFS